MARDKDNDAPVIERSGAILPPEPEPAFVGSGAPSWLEPGVLADPATAPGAASPPTAPATEMPGYDPMRELFGRADAAGKGLAAIEEERGRSLESSSSRFTSLLDRDRADMERAKRATAASAEALPPPWDADRERQQRIRDPIENFGSVGSIFAMIASTFTRTPMTSALNGAAAAMQAIRASDERGYETAYQAWKDNTQLALKRFDMEKTLFDQSSHLMMTDMNAWRQQLMVDAARFDNKKHIFMLQNGMDKELIESVAAQAKAAHEMQKTYYEMEEFDRQRTLFRDGKKAFKAENPSATPAEDVQHSLRLLHDIKSAQRGLNQPRLNAEQALVDQIRNNPDLTPEEKETKINEVLAKRGAGRTSAGERELEPYKQDIRNEHPDWTAGQIAEEAQKRLSRAKLRPGSTADSLETQKKDLKEKHPDWTEAQVDKEANEILAASRRGVPILTTNRQKAAEVERRKKQYVEDGMEETAAYNKATREVELVGRMMSGNQMARVQARVDAIGLSRDIANKAETLLNKHNGIAGLGGAITRPMESIGNMLSITNQTDRKQFERYINELHEWGPSVLLDRTGRPLSSEASKMSAVIAGLRAGDTTANTKRAFNEIRELWDTIQGQLTKQLQGDWSPRSGPGSTGAPRPSGGNWWDKAPEAGMPGIP